MLSGRSPRQSRRPGAVLAKVLMTLVVLVGVVALNLDCGRAMDERRRAQAAADAAALAAGADLYTNYWTYRGVDALGSARAAAVQVAAANGYPATAVTVNVPPLSGPYVGQAGHAEVRIDTALSATFGTIFTGEPIAVTARSVGRGLPVQLGIILLRPNGADSFRNSALAFALVNKPLIVNSKDLMAFHSTGLAIASLSRIDVTGGALNTSLLPLTARMRTGIEPTLDPLAFLPVPDAAAATVRSTTPLTINTPIPVVLQPGVYRGGIRVTGLSTVVLSAGTYILEGGGFRVDGAGTVTALDATIYNTTSSTYADGPISVGGLGKVAIVAPLSGTYQGIAFFQDRGMTQPLTVTGAGLTTVAGVVYAAKAAVTLSGSAAAGLDLFGGAYVADSMTVTGVGAVTVNLGLNPPRVPDVRLVE